MKLAPWMNGVVLAGLLALIVWLGLTVYAQRRVLRAAQLHADSVEVAADSSRRYWVGQTQVAARRAYQGQVQLAAALQQLQATGATLVGVRLERDSLRRVGVGRASEDTAARTVTARGELAADSLGVTVRADVVLGPVQALGPLTSSFTWDVVRHPILLDVALVCLPGHRAEAQITSPNMVPLTVTGAASRADICYPPPRWSPFSLRPPSLPWLVGAYLLGRL